MLYIDIDIDICVYVLEGVVWQDMGITCKLHTQRKGPVQGYTFFVALKQQC